MMPQAPTPTRQPPLPESVDHLFRAQHGEDRVLWDIFRHARAGYFIDVGAHNGEDLSNTYLLEQMGWHGILVEAVAELCQQARMRRPRSRIIHAACGRPDQCGTATFTIVRGQPEHPDDPGYVSGLSFLQTDPQHTRDCLQSVQRSFPNGIGVEEVSVPVRTLDDIIADERKAPHFGTGPWVPGIGWKIDLVSIDVEGAEVDVLRGFTIERFKPRVLVIENDRPSGRAIEGYLNQRGYTKFHRQVINDFYAQPAELNRG